MTIVTLIVHVGVKDANGLDDAIAKAKEAVLIGHAWETEDGAQCEVLQLEVRDTLDEDAQ